MLYVLEHGCKRRGLPGGFGNRHGICTRMSRRSKNGVSKRIFTRPQLERMPHVGTETLSLDSEIGTGFIPPEPGQTAPVGRRILRRTDSGTSYETAATAECAVIFFLSPGQASDAPEGRKPPTAFSARCDDNGQGIWRRGNGKFACRTGLLSCRVAEKQPQRTSGV